MRARVRACGYVDISIVCAVNICILPEILQRSALFCKINNQELAPHGSSVDNLIGAG